MENTANEMTLLLTVDYLIDDSYNTSTECGAKVVTWPLPEDPLTAQRMRLVELSGTLAFWDDPGEDIYDA